MSATFAYHGVTPLLLASVLLTLTPAVSRAQFTDTITTPNLSYDVNYTNDSPYNCASPMFGDDRDYFPTAQAQNAANALDNNNAAAQGNPPGYDAGYTGLGFLAPDFDGATDEVFISNCSPGCDSGNAPADRINLPSTTYCLSTERNIRRVMGHELMHHTQYAYITFGQWLNWGRTAIEGTARMMEDQVYADIDGDATMSFWGEAQNYLNNPNQDFWAASYRAALGWKYAAERYGTVALEPEIGVDFIVQFWANAQNNNASPNTPATFDETVKDFDNQSSSKEWFHDFSVANIAKELDVSGLVDAVKYRYIDENDGNGTTFSNVPRTWSGNIPGTRQAGSSVTRWGARYFEANVQECTRGQILGFRGEGDLTGYALLAITGTDDVESLLKGTSTDFAKSFIQPLKTTTASYTRLIAVAVGQDDAANFTYTFDCGQGSLDIRRPDVTYPAYVGDFDDPDTFLVRLVVNGPTSLGDPTVFGLQADDFEVFVGTKGDADDRATVLTGANVQGEYWLVVRAPVKPVANGVYDLHVVLGDALMDSEDDAVSYEKLILDEVIVIDTSGSMGSPAAAPKIEAARNAASLFVDVLGSDDKVGLVTFSGDNSEPNDDAKLVEILATATSGHRTDVKNAIAGLSDGGLTSIGDGLEKARDEFAIRGTALGEDWIILLSDGMENEALFWTGVEAAIKNDGIRVNAIALGPDTDQVLLQEIATETGGEYYYVDVGTVAAPAPAAEMPEGLVGPPSTSAAAGVTLPNRLADAYAGSSESINRFERLWEVDGSLAPSGVMRYEIKVDEGGIEQATFAINWDDAADGIAVEIERPDGTVVRHGVNGARELTDSTHYVAHVPRLGPGTWLVGLRATSGSPRFKAILAGNDRRGASLDVYFAQYQNSGEARSVGARYLRGLPQPILATLVDRRGPVIGAEVTASVEHPDGVVDVLPLFDDGGHGDGNPDDGVYGNLYARTSIASRPNLSDVPGVGRRGSYNVVVEARGRDNLGGGFNRIRKASFQIFEEREQQDFDGDDMPTLYEDLHACLDPFKHDSREDPDEDGLDSGEEWARTGTDPCHPDTDLGGEIDGSEARRGANPFHPDDDALPRPVDVEVIDWVLEHVPFPRGIKLEPNMNLVRFPLHPSYVRMRVLASASPSGPFNVVDEVDPRAERGLYRHTGLPNDRPVYYKVQPLDRNGNVGAASQVFSGTPRDDPEPPIGGVEIDRGASLTPTRQVTLYLEASEDVTEMMVSNDARFPASGWRPFAPEGAWLLTPDPSSGLATVFVKLRDAQGNVSEVFQDSIRVETNVGSVLGFARRGDTGGRENIFAQVLGPTGVAPTFTQANGAFRLDLLEPGLYTIEISSEGYQPIIVENVSVRAGASTEIGLFSLERAPDTPPAPAMVPTLPLAAMLAGFLALLLTATRHLRGRTKSTICKR